jgi:hypothetical protein
VIPGVHRDVDADTSRRDRRASGSAAAGNRSFSGRLTPPPMQTSEVSGYPFTRVRPPVCPHATPDSGVRPRRSVEATRRATRARGARRRCPQEAHPAVPVHERSRDLSGTSSRPPKVFSQLSSRRECSGCARRADSTTDQRRAPVVTAGQAGSRAHGICSACPPTSDGAATGTPSGTGGHPTGRPGTRGYPQVGTIWP